MDRDQILRMLDERETVGRVEVARLEEEAARLTVLIEACRREVDRLAIAREVLSGLAEELPGAVPAGHDLRPESVLVDQLLTILGAAGRPVRCKDVVAALGEDPAVARRVERVRNRLKKLVVAGRVVETEPGLFTLAEDSGPSRGDRSGVASTWWWVFLGGLGLSKTVRPEEDPMAPYPRRRSGTDDYAASRALFDALITRMGEAEMTARPEHVVEEFIADAGRDVLQQMLQDHLDARAAGEPRLAEVAGADRVVRRRAEPGHTRLLGTTFGEVEVTRIAYRAPGVSNLHPADAGLSLPDGRYSYPLQKAVVHQSVTGALREARDGLARMTGVRVGTQQLMQITVDAAQDVRDFYAQHRAPAPVVRDGEPTGRDLLVLSVDSTGVNMIDSGLREPAPTRPAGPQPPSAQLACRERAGRTRMAVVTAVYDAAPAVRDPADILPTGASERSTRRPGPKAVNRELDASIVDSTAPMVTRLFDRAEKRDPQHQRRWIVLVDGNNHQIDRIHAEAHTHGVKVNVIVDFIHVLQYLWDAAADLHPTQPGRAGFVARTARDLLEHHPARVILDLTYHHDTLAEAGTAAPGLKRCIDYLTAKQPYLIYRIALTMGWPIATGVIEGACRYLVKDRLAITGARWSLPGAEAVLLLRAVITNGDFEAYWKFHLQQEHQRTHTSRYQHQYDLAA